MMKKQIPLYLGWPEGEYIFIFFVLIICLICIDCSILTLVFVCLFTYSIFIAYVS